MADTQPLAPTDADILAVIREVSQGSAMRREGGLSLRIARAVLAKWGAPQPVACEPVACGNCGGTGWMVRDPDIGTDQECFVCDGSGRYSESATPQLTQAQAGAITPPPIECDTDDLKRAYAFGWWSALEKQRETTQAGRCRHANSWSARLQQWSASLMWLTGKQMNSTHCGHA